METKLVICSELATVANSKLVKDMMLVYYERQVEATSKEVHDLRHKVSEKRMLINNRDKMIKELELLYGFDSALESIADLRRMQEEDMMASDRLLVDIAQKHKRLGDLGNFITKLGSMNY
jgi:hypothetical protein